MPSSRVQHFVGGGLKVPAADFSKGAFERNAKKTEKIMAVETAKKMEKKINLNMHTAIEINSNLS